MSRLFVGTRATSAPRAVGNGNGNGNSHLNGHTTPAPAPARAGLPEPGLDVALPDWDVLLSAVTARMRRLGDGWSSPGAGGAAAVLECAQALEQLQTTLVHEVGLRRRLELEMFDSRVALAMARAALAGTQAGERQARHQALHDGLTALPNRTHFRARLQAALDRSGASGPSLAVIYLDLDGFKPINDRHGHAAGDELLRIVAARLARALRADDMVGRLGGDEFACLLTDVPDPRQLAQLARKLFDTIAAPLQIGRLELHVRASIGIAVCPADGMTAEILLQRADTAMYRAKRLRTGHAFFDPHADEPAQLSVLRAAVA